MRAFVRACVRRAWCGRDKEGQSGVVQSGTSDGGGTRVEVYNLTYGGDELGVWRLLAAGASCIALAACCNLMMPSKEEDARF